MRVFFFVFLALLFLSACAPPPQRVYNPLHSKVTSVCAGACFRKRFPEMEESLNMFRREVEMLVNEYGAEAGNDADNVDMLLLRYY